VAACEQSLRRLQNRLHRPLLAAQLGRAHADRRDPWRRSTTSCAPARSLPGRVGHARLEDRRSQRDRPLPRLVGVHRLQIEYSLLERSVEQELVPMALELGLGITPWSPLKSGALSGKYTRKNAGEVKGDRGFMDSFVNEKAFTVVDALEGHARLRLHQEGHARDTAAMDLAMPSSASTR